MSTYTYTQGFYLTARENITKASLISLCNELNSKYVDTGLTFQPEPITEGGIVYRNINGYKSIRISFIDPYIKRNKSFIPAHSVRGNNAWGVSDKHLKKLGVYDIIKSNTMFDWPIVRPNVMEDWVSDNEIILYAGFSVRTYLKAFEGAPVFTENELKIFGDCSEKIGLVVDSKYQKNKDLISYGKLGDNI